MVFKYATLALMLSATSSYALWGYFERNPVPQEEEKRQFGKVIGSPTDAKRLGGHETTMMLLQDNRDALQEKFDAEKARIEDQIEGLEKLSVALKRLIANYPGVDSNKFAPSQDKSFRSFNTSIEKILKTTSDFNHDSLKGQALLKTQIQLLNAFFAEFKARENELKQLERQVPEETAGQAARMQETGRLNQRVQLLRAMLKMDSQFSGVRESELFKMRDELIANTKNVLTILDGPISQGVLLEIKKLQMTLAGKNPEAFLNVLRAELAEMDKAIELTQKRAKLNAGGTRDPNGAPPSGSRKPAPAAPMVAPKLPQAAARPQPQGPQTREDILERMRIVNNIIDWVNGGLGSEEYKKELIRELRELKDKYDKTAN